MHTHTYTPINHGIRYVWTRLHSWNVKCSIVFTPSLYLPKHNLKYNYFELYIVCWSNWSKEIQQQYVNWIARTMSTSSNEKSDNRKLCDDETTECGSDANQKSTENEATNTKHHRKRKKQFYNAIRSQMEFYFSDANLSKDRFLKKLIADNPCECRATNCRHAQIN